MSELLGTSLLIDWDDFTKLVARFAFNFFFASIVIRGVYERCHKNPEYVFTYYLFNVVTFSTCLLLRKVPIELGFALGLFAVFGILRYRTEPIRIRDLTYLFIVIGIAILNAVSNKKISVAELAFVNGAIVGITAFLEIRTANRGIETIPIQYDNLKLLAPESRPQLLEDLAARTGLKVYQVDIVKIDMMRDSADLIVSHRSNGH
jgi:hypothetical protein